MSANNWTVCPRCKAVAIKKRKELQKQVEAGYGTLPAHEYKILLADSEKLIPNDTMLREDWELGMDSDGEFSVSYVASCHDCAFSFTFKYSEIVP